MCGTLSAEELEFLMTELPENSKWNELREFLHFF